MSAIVWLASYPKSGNTWLRALLTNYLRDGDEPASINALGDDWGAHATARLAFDELVGLQASELDPRLVDRLRPAVYRQLALGSEHDLFLKVHDAWRSTDAGEPLFPPDATLGVVYILRHPFDVAVSWSHHLGVDIEEAAERMCGANRAEVPPKRLNDQLPQLIGSWGDHARSWIDDSGLRSEAVRYEDLRADPEGVFARVVRFCGLPEDLDRVRKAVAFSEFAELRRQELEQGFRERAPTATSEFFRRGEAGGWRDELPAELAARLMDTTGEMMRRFGYLDKATIREVAIGARLRNRS